MEIMDSKIFYRNVRHYMFINESQEKLYNVYNIYHQIFSQIILINHCISHIVVKNTSTYLSIQQI